VSPVRNPSRWITGPNFNHGRSKSGPIVDGCSSPSYDRVHPWNMPSVNRLNGRLRDECLNVHPFASLDEAQTLSDAWRLDYNASRPHSSLRHLTPNEFVAQRQANQLAEEVVWSS
jgi:hypothetical protein